MAHAKNTVRVIGGVWRRRLLRFPDALGLRPTPDRVRETLFNWLGQTLEGERCLDLFAGSGALGFEAASRGAAEVTLVDHAPAVIAALRDNLQALGPPPGGRLEVIRDDALQFAARAKATGLTYDIIFVDPPYREHRWPDVRAQLDALAAPGARVYAEADEPLSAAPGWTLSRHGKAGQVFHHLFEKDPTHAE